MEDAGFVDVSVIIHSAVYALLYRGRVQYIGISKNPIKRIPHHYPRKDGKRHTPWGTLLGFLFDQVMILPCPYMQLEATEIAMIKRYKPKYNITHNKPSPEQAIDISDVLSQLMFNYEAPSSTLRRL